MDENTAATVIQAQFRSFRARQNFRRQQAAASKIQDHVGRFLARRQALEHEKRLIHGLPLEELDALQAKRHAAATTIQAHWRGARHRQQLLATFPALGGLRPITCCSPTLPEDYSGLLPSNSSTTWQPQPAQHAQHGGNIIRTLRQQQQEQELQREHSDLSIRGPAEQASIAAAEGLASSVSRWGALAPCTEESSWLSAEGSRLSAAGAPALEGSGIAIGQRRTAIPAANKAMLERQVKIRVDAACADASALRALRDRQQQVDQRLQQLLQQHSSTEGKRLQAVRRRQRLLQKADTLHAHLKQLPQLDQLCDSAWPAQYSLPRPGSVRSERAQQAHAMSMGEARVQGKWWTPLKQLNHMHSAWATQAAVDARADGVVRMQRDWEQQEAAWRSGWAHVMQQEQQRT